MHRSRPHTLFNTIELISNTLAVHFQRKPSASEFMTHGMRKPKIFDNKITNPCQAQFFTHVFTTAAVLERVLVSFYYDTTESQKIHVQYTIISAMQPARASALYNNRPLGFSECPASSTLHCQNSVQPHKCSLSFRSEKCMINQPDHT